MFCPGYVGNRFRYFVSEKGFGSGGREEGHPFVLSEGSGCNHHSGPLDRARAKRHLPGGCVVLTIPTASLLLIPPDTRSYPGSFVSPTAQLGGWWCVLGAACTCGSVLPIPNVRQATVRSGSPVSRSQDPGAACPLCSLNFSPWSQFWRNLLPDRYPTIHQSSSQNPLV